MPYEETKKIFFDFGALSEGAFLKKEFEWAQKRNVKERVAHGFLKTYKPVIDDEPYRIFDRLSDYKAWCEKTLAPRPFGKAPFAAISSLLVLDVSNDTPSSSRLELTTNEIFQMDHLLFHRA